ncbi:dethiobiotin synthase [Moraxella sp. ZJ142]|uniref:dethiobiotin synthase n=1 Tax=Moraxella marmotae TaxID=3344520 RepID=UPI0035D40F7A
MSGCYFISGIDTDIGKTIATGQIAKALRQLGKSVITQKLVQTGCDAISDDILVHRQLMAMPLTDDDKAKLTMPALLSYPASPHLASRLDNKPIDGKHLADCTRQLSERYEVVLIEGAGGLMVPLWDTVDGGLMIDYIADNGYPVILVTSGRLGSINHTLLSLSVLAQRGITLAAIAYNHADDSDNAIISNDTQRYLQVYLAAHHPSAQWWNIPKLDNLNNL